MTSRHEERQEQRTRLPQERAGQGTPPAERDTSRPPAPNREGPGPALPLSIIIGIVVIFVLIFAIVLM